MRSEHAEPKAREVHGGSQGAALTDVLTAALGLIASVLTVLSFLGYGPTGTGLRRGLLVAIFGLVAVGALAWVRQVPQRAGDSLVAALAAAGVLGLSAVASWSASAELSIASPTAGEVRSPVHVSGQAHDLDDSEVWVLVRPENADYYTTNRRPLEIVDGEWSLTTELGRGVVDNGVEYSIRAVALQRRESERLEAALRQTADDEVPAQFSPEELSDDLNRAVASDSVRVRLTESADTAGTGEIRDPVDGAGVVSPFDVAGTASLPAGRGLWILVRPENNRFYTTSASPISVGPDGQWEHRALSVGRGERDLGREFDLFLVAAPPDGEIAQALRARPPDRDSADFPSLPEDALEIDRITVTLTGVAAR